MTTPLVLFTYNRPAHTRRALKALSRCERLGDVAISLYSDGPKKPEHEAAVMETRALLSEFAMDHSATIVARDRNLGLAGSISSTVGELTAKHGRVIVLEDDLVVAPDFLNYMLLALERYRDTPEVMQVAGCVITGEVACPYDAHFLPVTTTWGWATWARAWTHYRPEDVDPALLDKDRDFRDRFTLHGAGDIYRGMLADRLAGRNDSWGILWWYAVAKVGGQVLYPRRSLVWNGGFDSSGVHCGGDNAFEPEPPVEYHQRRLSDAIVLPKNIETDRLSYNALRRHLNSSEPIVSTRFRQRLARLIAPFRR